MMPILCKVTRGFYIESIHVAYAVVVDADGKIVFNSGDPKYVTCVRSALKPFQAAASVLAGAIEAAGFTSQELALICSSHSGEEIHVKTAAGILKKLGYTTNDYECGSHMPYHKASAEYLIRQGQTPTPLHNNCSGKHAGMLALAKHLKVDPKGYALPDHPVQKLVLKQVERYSGLHDLPIGVDGCSLPTPFLPLYSIAAMFQKLASGDYPELNLSYEAMTKHPYLVAGEKRFDTDFLKVLASRAVTKVGGEAIRGVGIRRPDGEIWGMAVKVLDGNQRANPVATLTVLKHLDLLTEAELTQLEDYQVTKLFNHRKIHIGNISGSIEE
ncbi:MAG: asparaginase [Candidatus Marinimicrobia bacterium]|nr:asparaginase [Candidatus Neomarinimicrobiota bacterium]